VHDISEALEPIKQPRLLEEAAEAEDREAEAGEGVAEGTVAAAPIPMTTR
jgi:hypothetical protein